MIVLHILNDDCCTVTEMPTDHDEARTLCGPPSVEMCRHNLNLKAN